MMLSRPTASSLTVENSGGHGIKVNANATLSLENSYINASQESGMVGQGTTSVTTSIFSNNQEYGLVCSDETLVTCSQITHDSNVLGEQDGCDSTCGIPTETTEPEEPTE